MVFLLTYGFTFDSKKVKKNLQVEWLDFSTLEGSMCVLMHSCFCEAKLPNLKLKTWAEPVLGHGVCICDIDFFNFRHSQVRNFKILNYFERDQTFVVNFKKDQKQN